LPSVVAANILAFSMRMHVRYANIGGSMSALDPTPRQASRTRRNLIRGVAAAAALCAATALMPGVAADAGTKSADTAAAPAATYETFTSVPYAPNGNAQQNLDLYLPTHAAGPVPLIVYVHGGGWFASSSAELLGMSGWDTFLSQGFALASLNYTLSDTARFPQQIFDVKAVAIPRLHRRPARLPGRHGRAGQPDHLYQAGPRAPAVPDRARRCRHLRAALRERAALQRGKTRLR
jgi:hypothetical protein